MSTPTKKPIERTRQLRAAARPEDLVADSVSAWFGGRKVLDRVSLSCMPAG